VAAVNGDRHLDVEDYPRAAGLADDDLAAVRERLLA
jgi:hypothetical protein